MRDSLEHKLAVLLMRLAPYIERGIVLELHDGIMAIIDEAVEVASPTATVQVVSIDVVRDVVNECLVRQLQAFRDIIAQKAQPIHQLKQRTTAR